MFEKLVSLTRQISEFEGEITETTPYQKSVQSRKLLQLLIKEAHALRLQINELRKKKTT